MAIGRSKEAARDEHPPEQLAPPPQGNPASTTG